MIIEAARKTNQTHTSLQQAISARRWLHWFFATRSDSTGLILRLALAATLFPHGAQKVLGWFGGYGFQGTLAGFTSMGMPAPLALLIMAAEFLGPIALVAGFFTRWSGFGIGLTMAGAALMAHLPNGFFMNWMGTQKGEGIEYFIPVVAIAVVLILKGGGAWAVDSLLARRIEA
ncbi:MAG: DoxX family protein [Fibrobacteria bacterium]